MAKKQMKISLTSLSSALAKGDFRWSAGDSKVSKLSESKQMLRLGLAPVKKDLDRVKVALAAEAPPVAFAAARDWRAKDGKNWVTGIRDQGNCGSCVAFGTVAAIECQAKIQYNKSDWNLDLSEADLFFCGAGRKCSEGWWPSYALDYAKSKGVSDEACFPYQDHNMDCKLCDDKAKRMVKVESWKEIAKIDERKAWLDKHGPLVACMAVYKDFFYYKKGVYKPTTDDLAGYHAICCVGYNEAEKCWICKNSWGSDWGENGFFKIEYGQADIDTKFAMYAVEKLTSHFEDNNEDTDEKCAIAKNIVIEYSFAENRRVLWAHLDGDWRHQLLSDAQLAAIGSELFDADTVEGCYKGEELVRIYGWKNFS